MKIDDQLIEKLATLARLEFNPQEKEQLKVDLEKMIAFIGKLGEVDTASVEPLIHLNDEVNVLREDVVDETSTHEEVMLNVPVSRDGYISVPMVFPKTEAPK